MPIFISYNHSDKDFAESLALILTRAKQNVWIDKWELNAGDSLIERIEDALGGADAILVLLSKNSVESEWCKKELRTALTRELEEKAVLVIPIILDDCKIPLFLKEKLRIDFRRKSDRDEQLTLLLRSLERISNPAQGRVDTPDYHIDWSMNVLESEDEQAIQWIFVDHSAKLPYVIMTEVIIFPSGNSASPFAALNTNDEKFVLAAKWMQAALSHGLDFTVVIESAIPVVLDPQTVCVELFGDATIFTTVRRMGEDNGMDTLVQVDNNLREAVKHTLGVNREAP